MLLGIESSCDESALALFDPQKGIVNEWIHSQLDLHKAYGGVVPDLASRSHVEQFSNLLPKLKDQNITQIAVTHGPGLASCLAIGVTLGKALSLGLQVPLFGVNHLRGHAFSPFIPIHQEDPAQFKKKLQSLLPHLGLIVSGGNTLLFCIKKDLQIEILAQTVDDAAGEALDKGAKLLGMPYPGGPLIEKEAQQGDPDTYTFPKAFSKPEEMAFSFSGLKTSLRYLLEKIDDQELEKEKSNICASYQKAVVQALTLKVKQMLEQQSWASIGLSGGVANNQILRQSLSKTVTRTPLLIAEPRHTGDNASMIAFAAYIDPTGVVENKAWGLKIEPSLRLTLQ